MARIGRPVAVRAGEIAQLFEPCSCAARCGEYATALGWPDDGTLTVRTSHAGSDCELRVTPAGQVSASLVTAGPGTAAVGRPANGAAMGGVLATAVGQLALAVYLLVIGILTLRQSPRGRQLHWVFVGLKVPIAVAAAAAVGWLWPSLSGGTGGWNWWAVPALAGLAYPVALALVLRGRSARDYYRWPAAVTSGGTRSAPW